VGGRFAIVTIKRAARYPRDSREKDSALEVTAGSSPAVIRAAAHFHAPGDYPRRPRRRRSSERAAGASSLASKDGLKPMLNSSRAEGSCACTGGGEIGSLQRSNSGSDGLSTRTFASTDHIACSSAATASVRRVMSGRAASCIASATIRTALVASVTAE
jgi:hypothetical protein